MYEKKGLGDDSLGDCLQNKSVLQTVATVYLGDGPPRILAGKRKIARIRPNTPSMAMPAILKGSRKIQIIG
jgi:hypothetical protein